MTRSVSATSSPSQSFNGHQPAGWVDLPVVRSRDGIAEAIEGRHELAVSHRGKARSEVACRCPQTVEVENNGSWQNGGLARGRRPDKGGGAKSETK